MIIGVDHGYSAMKTAHICFPSGIVRYEHEPYTNRGVLRIEGKYYVCGTGRQPLLRTKTENEQYYLLTLQLSHRKSLPGRLPKSGGGAGRWPPAYQFRREKKTSGLPAGKKNPVVFEYEGEL